VKPSAVRTNRKAPRVGFLPAMLISLMLVIAATAVAAAPEPAPEPLQLLQVSDTISLGVIPRKLSNYDELMEFEVVIDLRFPYEGVYDEQGTLLGNHVRYINIPTSSNAPTSRSLTTLEDELTQAAGKSVLIHDSDGYRSALIWAAHRVHEGADLETALAQVEPLTGGKEIRTKLQRYVDQLPPAGHSE